MLIKYMQEQKLSDIAHCVADVLRCTAGDPSETWMSGRKYLGVLINRLSSMRGKESRYLKPLMDKASPLFDGWKLNNTQTLPAPLETPMSYAPPMTNPIHWANSGPVRSFQESLDMMRRLSMNGNFGAPPLTLPINQWGTPRRESGRVFDEAETEDLNSWFNLDKDMVQAV